MGGRGAYWDGNSRNYEKREFDSIGKINNIKVLRVRKGVKNITLPQYSNTANTTYYSADETGIIKTVGFYRKHALVKSIDITSQGSHWHRWTDNTVTKKGVTTKSRLKILGENPITSERDKRILKQAEGKIFK